MTNINFNISCISTTKGVSLDSCPIEQIKVFSGNVNIPSFTPAKSRSGDFYASSGVYLDELVWDQKNRTIRLGIREDGDSTFTSELIGTRTTYIPDDAGGDTGVGEVIDSRTGRSITFKVPEDALYARVTVTSSRAATNPSFDGQKKQAWTQPIGWEPNALGQD